MAIIARVKKLLETGETFCLATVIVSDTAGIPPGSKAIVLGDGTVDSGLNSARLDLIIRDQALAALDRKRSGIAELKEGLRVFFNVFFSEARLLNIGHRYQRETDWHRHIPRGFE